MSAGRMILLVLSIAGFAGGLVSPSNAWEVRQCAQFPARSVADLKRLGATCMSQGERRITPERLEADVEVITKTYEALATSNTQTGIKDDGLLEKFAAAWTRFRWEDQKTPLQVEVLIGGSGYGRLSVMSEPPGASVHVNNEKWKDPTNTSQWTPEGRKEIVLKRDRCEDETGNVTVTAGEPAEFKRKLTCKP